MQSFTLSVCRRCRLALSRQIHTSSPVARTGRPSKARREYLQDARTCALPYRHSTTPQSSHPREQSPAVLPTPRKRSLDEINKMLFRNIIPWSQADTTIKRLTTLGLEETEAKALLKEYASYIGEEIRGSKSMHSKDADPWGISRHLENHSSNRAIIDRALTMRLFSFASKPDLYIFHVRPESLHVLAQAHQALDLRYPAEVFHIARCRRRKVFLHVGPTNSGKTYNALRALATSRNGVYAGPLRLLAHEVWERLNRGSIRPHDADPSTAHLYARECNLITGEEQRIVSSEAPLSSCTVEMINLYHHYEVCVIDEIQMIADPTRGNSWTTAVLGVAADEVHLCGEEAAVPLIEALMQETGDELVIKRYERLTPLAVAKKSLEGRWDRIEKGDCVVTFSRSSIFALKRMVEQATGLRCAVAYGRLPPETRSEQAALFNDPDSGYDVMVASDAIGMGLNLKIKRVVFVQLTKYNGMQEVQLSPSQIKQIGGRAGRFGTHGDSSSTGIVTCLNSNDLPFLAKAFSTPPSTLNQAIVPLHLSVLSQMAQLLPESFGLKDLHSLLSVACSLGPNYCLPELAVKSKGMEIIDRYGKDLRLVEKMLFATSPTSWRTEMEVEVFGQYLRQFAKGYPVDLRGCLQESGLLQTLDTVSTDRKRHEEKVESNPQLGPARGYSSQSSWTLATLETLHKVIVNYIWMSFRMPMSFSQSRYAGELKETTEKAIEFVLEGIENVRLEREIKTTKGLRGENRGPRIQFSRPIIKTSIKAQRAKLTSS